MKTRIISFLLLILSITIYSQRPVEYLDRGLVAIQRTDGIFLSWRMLGTDPEDVGFLIYRNDKRVMTQAYSLTTSYLDTEGSVNDKYIIKTVINNSVVEVSDTASVWKLKEATEADGKPAVPFKVIPIPAPPVVDGTNFTPGDMGVGDLDGDGDYELVFEWEPDNFYNPFLDAIDLDGNHLWRISCGPNTIINDISFLVYDLDQDGKAEVSMKTGPGTIDGTGEYLSTGPAATDDDQMLVDRVSGGHLMSDPAYLSVFNGETGKELATVDFWPPIGPLSQMEAVWGDDYGKRSGSIKSAILYTVQDGPLLVFSRGIYTRIGMAAYKWNGDSLSTVWKFDTESEGFSSYAGQGNHSVGVGDVDGDGSDELMYGACVIDHDGKGLYSTGRGHGDSHHLGDHDPEHPGLEYFQPHENATYGISMRDAGTGDILWEYLSSADVGRAWAADVDPNFPGSEISAIGFPNYDCHGDTIETEYNPYFQPVYFDGDVQRELRKENAVNGVVGGPGRIFTGWYYGASTIHSTKQDANLVADILGDWREEIIFRHYDNTKFLLFSSWLSTNRKNYTLMHDPTYRMNIAVQSVGYNQPAHTGYYFPDGAPTPDISIIKYTADTTQNIDTTRTSIDREIEFMLSVYPNPAESAITVDTPLPGKKSIYIYSISGEMLLERKTYSQVERINIETLERGVYILRVFNNDRSIFRKFVIGE